MSYESACKNGKDTGHNQNVLHDSFPIMQKYSIYLLSTLITLLKASFTLYLPPGLPLTFPSQYFDILYDPYTNIHLFLFKIHRLLYLMGSNCVLRQVDVSLQTVNFHLKNWILLSSNKDNRSNSWELNRISYFARRKRVSEYKSLQNLSHILYRIYVKD